MLDAASCVSCPWDFGPNNAAVHRPNVSERMYHLILTTAIKVWVLAHYTELKSNPLVVKRWEGAFMSTLIYSYVPKVAAPNSITFSTLVAARLFHRVG